MWGIWCAKHVHFIPVLQKPRKYAVLWPLQHLNEDPRWSLKPAYAQKIHTASTSEQTGLNGQHKDLDNVQDNEEHETG